MSWLEDHQPVLVKELRGRMRGTRAFVLLTIFLTVLSGFTILLYVAMRSAVGNDPFNAGRTIGKVLFLGVTGVALLQIMVIVPAQAAGAISIEREHETYDLLLATLLPAWKIVIGKLLAAFIYALLLIVAVVPLMGVASFFGGVTGAEVLIALLGLLVTTILYGAVGILWSVLSSRTMAATVMAQATNLLILLGLPFLGFVFGSLFIFTGSKTPEWIETYPFVYGAGIFAAIHPFIALGAAETFLSNGESRLLIPLNEGQANEIWIPAPWLAFTIEGLIVAAILIFIAVRLVRPYTTHTRKPRPKGRGRGKTHQQPQDGEAEQAQLQTEQPTNE